MIKDLLINSLLNSIALVGLSLEMNNNLFSVEEKGYLLKAINTLTEDLKGGIILGS